MRPDLGFSPPHKLSSAEISADAQGYAEPLSCFMIKGWSRSFTAMVIMAAAWECEAFREALRSNGFVLCLAGLAGGEAQETPASEGNGFLLSRTFATVHAAVNAVPGESDASELVMLNRGRVLSNGLLECLAEPGVTLASIRRRPHALNLLHQMKLLAKTRRPDEDFKALKFPQCFAPCML